VSPLEFVVFGAAHAFASITAGSMGMGFRHFLIANFAGHVVLGLILAIFGTWLTGD